MKVKLYNSLTNRLEVFTPITEGKVKIYSCGPTVYDYPHIGNYRSFIFSDFLQRFFELLGYEVEMVMNVTDIDDKTIKASVEKQQTLSAYTEKYLKAFFSDVKQLGFLTNKRYPRATDHIGDMIAMIEILLKKKVAYEINGSVYFSISKYKDYGQLANLNVGDMLVGEKNFNLSDEYQKDNLADFALWKAYRLEDGDNHYPSPWGKGRPGWHIECSAMSKKYLGDHFDIHTGGIDNRFPHHENEIAQSKCVSEKDFVNYWLHVSHLLVEEEKMSKSLGNFHTLNDLLKKGHNPMSLRYMLISTHYRNNYNFTFKGIEAADKTIAKVNRFIKTVLEKRKSPKNLKTGGAHLTAIKEFETQFKSFLCNDLNISASLGTFHDFIAYTHKHLEEFSEGEYEEACAFLKKVNSVLGVFDFSSNDEGNEVPLEVRELMMKRDQARKEKNFQLADDFRKQIFEKGYLIEDSKEKTRLLAKD